MQHRVAIIGAGMAGLTAAAYLSRDGFEVEILEKQERIGGLVNSFERGGFVFDAGIRAVENSGIVLPMLRQLGIEMDFLDNQVSVGIGNDVIRLGSRASLEDYRALLERHFPSRGADIAAIVAEVAKVMDHMDTLYGIDNPLFMDLKDPEYLLKTLLPWVIRFISGMPKMAGLDQPVDEHLATFTKDASLIDMIAQHFFKKTPSSFALSYFSLYLDYKYPRGGTGSLPERLGRFIEERGGRISRGVEVASLDPDARRLVDTQGREYGYDSLLWAADAKTLYRVLKPGSIQNSGAAKRVRARALELSDKTGGDSVFSLYLSLDLPPEYFSKIASGHFFYTPVTKGLSQVDLGELKSGAGGAFTEDKASILAWLRRYLELTTYEIACPALRDPSLAPPGKTGLIISSLMDFTLVEHAEKLGWGAEFRSFCTKAMIEILEKAIYPGLGAALIESFNSTPLSISRINGSSDGAKTGWAFTNASMPAVHKMHQVASSVLTPIPGVYQAGQWVFSPSGLPIAILTGKLAADRIAKVARS